MKKLFFLFSSVVFLLSCSGEESAKSQQKTETDTLTKSEINPDWFLTLDTLSDATIAKNYLDSLIVTLEDGDLGTESFHKAYFKYSPDLRFKIMFVLGESCGAYCNPYNLAFYYYKSKGRLVKIEPEDYFVCPVDTIYPIYSSKDTSEYLLMGSTWCRPVGYESGENFSIQHLVVTADTLYFKKLKVINEDAIDLSESLSFLIYRSEIFCSDLVAEGGVDQPDDIGFNFDPKTLKITYKTTEWRTAEVNECRYYKGEFLYENGQFVQQVEKDITHQ